MSIIRNLRTLAGIPWEITRRILGYKWRLDRDIIFKSERYGRYISCCRGMKYDKFTWAPDLRKKDGSDSDAAPVHDAGWYRGTWDDGSPLTFDQNNDNLVDILDAEGHWGWVIRAYYRGVSAGFMRQKWIRTHGHH